MTPADVVVASSAALAMEPVAALAQRGLMHGPGWSLHRGHHTGRRGEAFDRPHGWEANDLFPLTFAALTVSVMALGAGGGPRALLWVGVGVAGYGTAYLLVHDLCIHGRIRRPFGGGRYLTWVREAHRLHHRSGRAPYGFLLPIVPAATAGPRRKARDGETEARATVPSLRPSGTRARPAKTS